MTPAEVQIISAETDPLLKKSELDLEHQEASWLPFRKWHVMLLVPFVFGFFAVLILWFFFSTDEIAASSVETLPITLKNLNYVAVDYFDDKILSKISYSFLDSYQGIIEPYASMEVHFYDRSYLDDENS